MAKTPKSARHLYKNLQAMTRKGVTGNQYNKALEKAYDAALSLEKKAEDIKAMVIRNISSRPLPDSVNRLRSVNKNRMPLGGRRG